MTEANDGCAIAFSVDNGDVFHRRDFSWGWHSYSRARYHFCDFLLRPVGRITCATLRLDLYRAALVGKIVTDRGTIALHAFVHAEQPHMTIATETSGAEDGCQWPWHPTPAVSPRPTGRRAERRIGRRRVIQCRVPLQTAYHKKKKQ